MHISSSFDSGNIEVIDAQDPSAVRLRIRRDAGDDHFQWFYFRVTGARGQALSLRIENAGESSYPEGFQGYLACVSHDRQHWGRASTSFDGNILTIHDTPQHDSVYYAYFAPYSLERHADLIADIASRPKVQYQRLGASVEGRDLDLLRIGQPSSDRRVCWIIARQHPGETMAEFLVEGLLHRLVDEEDPVSQALLEKAVFYVVPNMNPDGSIRGHLRNNAAGQNLNRAWAEPTMERSPEVFLVRQKMEQTGVDFFLDVHGDEALPYNFISGSDGIPRFGLRLGELQASYIDELIRATPDFQKEFGYPIDPPGQANLTMASNWVGERFDCLSMTLEQPFKDTANHPHRDGWTPSRARRLGHVQLDALRRLIDRLR